VQISIIRLLSLENQTYLKILPLIDMVEVNGHFLSTYVPSIASVGVLNPKEKRN
jgi:hypothetical protein